MAPEEREPMDAGFQDRQTEHEVDDEVASGEGKTPEELEEERLVRAEQPEPSED